MVSVLPSPFSGFHRREDHAMAAKSEAARAGISLGSALAITISWSLHKSLLWAILHGALSWFYVIYYAIVR